MPTPLEQYRAWERSGPVVHVMQIERGDRRAAFRLTLTDRPYYDRGVGGVKYHHTYPAPIHCIISDIVSEESMSGSSFGEIVLSNGSGLLDGIQGFPNIQGQPFVIYRGSPDWSLMETDFPNKFLPIMRGQVDGVTLRQNGAEIVLQVSPRRYLLGNTIGGPTTPIALGRCRNVPATLVDAANLRYRFSSIPCYDSASMFKVRDAGVELALMTDYTLVLEGGVWRGQIELASPASGDLTADIQSDYGDSPGAWAVPAIVNWLLHTYVVSDSLYNSEADLSPQLANAASYGGGMFFLAPDGSKLYASDTDGGCYQYSVADPISGASYDSKSFSFPNDYPSRLNAAGDALYAIRFVSQATIYPLSTPGDISTVGSISSTQALGIPDGYLSVSDLYITDDERQLWLAVPSTAILVYDIGTPGDLTTAALSQIVELRRYIGNVMITCMDLSGDRRHLYILDGNREIHQLDLVVAEDLTEIVAPVRRYHYPDSNPVWMRMHPAGDRLYLLNEAEGLEQHDLQAANALPESVASWPGLVSSIVAYNSVAEFVSSETEVGAVITSLMNNINGVFYVSRLGEIRMCLHFNPRRGASERSEEIAEAELGEQDCLGDGKSFVAHVASHRAVQAVTVTYDHNWFVQQRSSLAGTVTEDDAEYYGKPYLSWTAEVTAPEYQEREQRFLETRTANLVSARELADDVINIWGTRRAEYEVSALLAATPLYELFGPGDKLVLRGGLSHPDFTVEPYLAFYNNYGADHAESPDSVTNSFSGDFRIRMKIQLMDLGMSNEVIVGKGLAATDIAFRLRITTGGLLALDTSLTGSFITTTAATVPLTDIEFRTVEPIWLMVDMDLDNGASARAMRLAYCHSPGLDLPADGDWVDIETVGGSALTGLFNSSQPITIAANADDSMACASLRVHRLYIDAAGAPASDFDARRYKTGDTMSSSVAGETWTLNNNPVYPGHPRALVTGRRINWSKGIQTLRVFR